LGPPSGSATGLRSAHAQGPSQPFPEAAEVTDVSPSGHQLPAGMAEERSGEGPPPAPEPTHAERTRTLVAGTNRGTLSTVCLDPAGYPFGSVATYALDGQGRPILFVSTMAEHTRNARSDPRASLIVADVVPAGSDPLAAARATLIGDLGEVTGAERAEVRDIYLAANPASAYYIDFGDFSFWRLEVLSVRYVGGYGRMSWVEAADYARAEADPLAGETATGIIEHMNADHADSMVLMARVLGGRADATEAVMSAVDRYGFDLVAGGPGGRAALRIGFDAPVATPAAVRPAMIRLVERARREV
jgi:heme iron utilization protein